MSIKESSTSRQWVSWQSFLVWVRESLRQRCLRIQLFSPSPNKVRSSVCRNCPSIVRREYLARHLELAVEQAQLNQYSRSRIGVHAQLSWCKLQQSDTTLGDREGFAYVTLTACRENVLTSGAKIPTKELFYCLIYMQLSPPSLCLWGLSFSAYKYYVPHIVLCTVCKTTDSFLL